MMKLAQHLGISRYEADEHYRAGLAAFVRRDLPKSIQALETAVELLPKHAEYHAALGFVLLDDKRQREAVAAFERALKLNPYEMLANYGSGLIAYRAKKWLEAKNYFTVAHAAQPKRAETHYYLAMVNHRVGQNADALRWMERAAKAFAETNDRRESHCAPWMREFQKLLASD